MNSGYQNSSMVEDCLVNRRKRCKSDWAGVGIGDAFNSNIDYFQRITAQRMFYKACRKAQVEAARVAGRDTASGYAPVAKPQLGPCYTSYPATIAAYAAIGLTGYLEFDAVAQNGYMVRHVTNRVSIPEPENKDSRKNKAYLDLVQLVSKCVQTRLFLEDLSRKEGLPHIEIHRLFSASQQTLRFESLPEILNAGIVFGEVLPDWKTMKLHPVTLNIFEDVESVSADYHAKLKDVKSHELAEFGAMWVSDLCKILFKHLPESKERVERSEGENASLISESGAQMRSATQEVAEPSEGISENSKIAPLNGPNPPMLSTPPSAAERMLSELSVTRKSSGSEESGSENCDSPSEKMSEALNDFSKATGQAAGQQSQSDDMRSDLVESVMQQNGFSSSPVEGNPTDGHEVSMVIDGSETVGGEIFDRPVELSDDIHACNELMDASRPIAATLRKTLYPNIEERVETDRLRSQGSLDPARLAMADFSSAVFKRYNITGKEDRNGKPLLLIACDGSGSLNSDQMRMVKTLSAAWLQSTAGSPVQVMAALYHSGRVRKGVTGPLVQWIYHPQKTPAVSRVEAIRGIASLPDTGTGYQKDALSLQFIMEEAIKVSRGRKIYLILISDCKWNRSFGYAASARKEMVSFFDNADKDTSGNLHTTLVALGVDGETGFEDLLDKVIVVPSDELLDVCGMAEQIGVYVASCMKERRRFIPG